MSNDPKKKEEEKKKAFMPLADRLGLDAGTTMKTPTITAPTPINAPAMGNLVDGAMQKRRDEQEGGGLPAKNNLDNRMLSKQGGRPV